MGEQVVPDPSVVTDPSVLCITWTQIALAAGATSPGVYKLIRWVIAKGKEVEAIRAAAANHAREVQEKHHADLDTLREEIGAERDEAVIELITYKAKTQELHRRYEELRGNQTDADYEFDAD